MHQRKQTKSTAGRSPWAHAITVEFGFRANRSTSSIEMTSILLYTYRHFTYFRLPSMTSIRSSVVASSRNRTSQLWSLYSCKILYTVLYGSSPSYIHTIQCNLKQWRRIVTPLWVLKCYWTWRHLRFFFESIYRAVFDWVVIQQFPTHFPRFHGDDCQLLVPHPRPSESYLPILQLLSLHAPVLYHEQLLQ